MGSAASRSATASMALRAAATPSTSPSPKPAPVAPIQKGLSFDEAASIGFGVTTAMYFLNSGKVGPGQSHPDHRRLRMRRHLLDPARQAPRCDRDRRLLGPQRRARALARRRPGDRLHDRGLRALGSLRRRHGCRGRHRLRQGEAAAQTRWRLPQRRDGHGRSARHPVARSRAAGASSPGRSTPRRPCCSPSTISSRPTRSPR